MTARAGKLAFVKLFVADLDPMIAFYERAFGCTVQMRFDGPDFEEVLLRQDDHDFLLGLLRWKTSHGDGAPTVGVIGIVTDDVDAAVAFACERGAALRQAPFDIPGTRLAFVTDPEGNEIELVQFVQGA